jgi:osmoprotectant transport system ATP-binding protein
VARALAAEPELVLLDEPFGALDAVTRARLHRLFEALRTELRFTAVLVTHDLAEAFRLADRVAVLRRGEVVRVGTPEEISVDLGPDYVRELLELQRDRRRDGETSP